MQPLGHVVPPAKAAALPHARQLCIGQLYGVEHAACLPAGLLADERHGPECCRDALLHVCRIHRILSQPRGNALLVGVGGSGRKSLARLAAYVAELKVFSIEITKTYRLTEFREDLKGMYRQTGVAGKPSVFLFDETQVQGQAVDTQHFDCLAMAMLLHCLPKCSLQAAALLWMQAEVGMILLTCCCRLSMKHSWRMSTTS